MTAADVSIFLVLSKSAVCVSFHLNACLEFISFLMVSMLRWNEGSSLASCSASCMNPLSSLVVVGLYNSLITCVSSLFLSVPLWEMVFPAYLML